MNVKVTNRHNQQQYSAIADYWGKELGWSFKIVDTRPGTWGRSLRGTGVGPVIDQGFQKELEQRGWTFPVMQEPEDVRDKEMARLAASFKKPTAESIVRHLLDEHCGHCPEDYARKLRQALDQTGQVSAIGGFIYDGHMNPLMSATDMHSAVRALDKEGIRVRRIDAGGSPTWMIENHLAQRHAIGVDVEKEHTSDPQEASKIADTHEKENKLYYPLHPKPKGAKEVLRWVKEDIDGNGNIHGSVANSAPSEKRQITIGEIFAVLSEEVQDEIMRLLNTEPDDMALTDALKKLLQPHAAALETIGIIPDYLAYMLLHVRNQMR